MATSFITNKEIEEGLQVQGKDIRDAIVAFIRSGHPGFSDEDYISLDELNKFRRLYMTNLASQEKGELAHLDEDVLDAIRNNSVLSENIDDDLDEKTSFGDRVADKIASFGGSWTFITIFFSFLFGWMLLNIFILITKPFDPFPFILLNLILSCLSAIQAPIIMMSQNRQGEKDRKRAEHDYKVNLKAELEIKLLSEKIDHLLVNQNKKLLEIQEVQIDYLEDLMKKIKQ